MSEQAGQSSWSLGGLLNYAQQTVNRLEGGELAPGPVVKDKARSIHAFTF